VTNPEGLIGDISAKKRWHEHFEREKLRKLLAKAGFNVVDFDGTGFFTRVIAQGYYFIRWFKPMRKVFTWLGSLDTKLFESMNLFCAAEKRQAG